MLSDMLHDMLAPNPLLSSRQACVLDEILLPAMPGKALHEATMTS